MTNPKRLILVGFILVLWGFVGPYLMVLGILKSTLLLNFVSYGASVSGLIMGMIGAAMLGKTNKKD